MDLEGISVGGGGVPANSVDIKPQTPEGRRHFPGWLARHWALTLILISLEGPASPNRSSPSVGGTENEMPPAAAATLSAVPRLAIWMPTSLASSQAGLC